MHSNIHIFKTHSNELNALPANCCSYSLFSFCSFISLLLLLLRWHVHVCVQQMPAYDRFVQKKIKPKTEQKNGPISPSSSSMCGNYRERYGIRSNIHGGYVYMHANTRLPQYDRSAAANDLLSVVCVHRKGKEGTIIIIIIAMIIEQWFENSMNVLIGVHSKSQLLRYQSLHRNNGQTDVTTIIKLNY